jgi:type II secretory pathway predicted ATPase ExeA
MDYKKFFGFHEAPFHLTPDPAYFFPSDAHREALQTLLYSIRAGEGFVQITGDPGTGKTLLIRTILMELGDQVSTALIFNPRLSPHELLRTLLEDLGLDSSMMENLSREALLRRFRDYLLGKAEQGERVIIIIDEAQNLPMDTLEELRLLSNLETEKEKLLQIILVGQRELEHRLEQPEVRQLHQRITIRYRLQHLRKQDIHSYIQHRLRVATPQESDVAVVFSPKALQRVHKASKGTPRLINIICERALMAAYVEGRKRVHVEDVKKALESIKGNELGQSGLSRVPRVVSVALLLAVLLGAGLFGAWMVKPGLLRGPMRMVAQTPQTSQAPQTSQTSGSDQTSQATAGRQQIHRTDEAASGRQDGQAGEPVDRVGESPALAGEVESGTRQPDERGVQDRAQDQDQDQDQNQEKTRDMAHEAEHLEALPDGRTAGQGLVARKDRSDQSSAGGNGKVDHTALSGATLPGVADPTGPEAAGQERAAMDQPPLEAFYVSAGAYFAQALISEGVIRIWKGTQGEPELVSTVKQLWPFGRGLFLLGLDPEHGAYVFNHSAFLRGNPTVSPSPMWHLLDPPISGNALPLIAHDRHSLLTAEQLQTAGRTRHLFQRFLTTWQNMQIDELFTLHGNIVTNHYLDQPKPIVLSRDQSYERKDQVFRRSGFINVQVDRPLFLVDPSNPENVMTVYHQQYRSRIWEDEGTKLLYFSLQDSDQGKAWKVAAELWVQDWPDGE